MKSAVLIAPGKLLTQEEVNLVKDSGLPTMLIGNVYNLIPNGDYCWHGDGRWWDYHWMKVSSLFSGRKLTCEAASVGKFGTQGLEFVEHVQEPSQLTPKGKVCGTSSGQHALIFMVNEEYDDLILVGYEYGAAGDGHYFGDHPQHVAAPSDWRTMCRDMGLTAARVAGKGVNVVNCTPTTALDCFRKADLKEELEKRTTRPTKARRSLRQES